MAPQKMEVVCQHRTAPKSGCFERRNGEKAGLMRDKLTINANRESTATEGRRFDLGLVDARQYHQPALKGEEFTIRERIRFNAPIQATIFTYTIKDKKELT